MPGNYDHARRRRAQRKQRERGCSLYVAEDELLAAGFVRGDPPPFYRVWSGPRGRLVVQLYRKG